MSPQDHDTTARPTRAAALNLQWDRYLATGTQRAHGDLLQEIDRHVRREARRMLGHRHPLFEEVAQEALVGAAKRIGTLERPDHPAAYLRKIVSNKVADQLQAEHRRRIREEQQWTPDLEPLEASMTVDWQDFLDTLRTIVSSDEYWTLLLKYHFDYSYGEIGQMLDKEPNAIRQIALRGRRKCKEHISRLQGRVPGWVSLLEREPIDGSPSDGGAGGAAGGPPSAGGEAIDRPATEADPTDGDGLGGDHGPGTREPRTTDPTDRQRRPSVGSDSGPGGGVATPAVVLATEPSEPAEPDQAPVGAASRRRRPLGTPMSVLPLVVAVVLPILIRLDSSMATPPVRPATLTAVTVAPSGPTLSPIRPTTPTASREASSSTTAADTTVELDPAPETGSSSTGPSTTAPTSTETTQPGPEPESTTTEASVPTTSLPTTSLPSTTGPTTTAVTTTPSTTIAPTTTRPTTTTRRTTTTVVTTTTIASSSSATTTTRPTTTTTTTTRPTTTTTTRPTTTTSTTVSTTTTAPVRTTTTGGSSTTASGRDPGDGGPPGDR